MLKKTIMPILFVFISILAIEVVRAEVVYSLSTRDAISDAYKRKDQDYIKTMGYRRFEVSNKSGKEYITLCGINGFALTKVTSVKKQIADEDDFGTQRSVLSKIIHDSSAIGSLTTSEQIISDFISTNEKLRNEIIDEETGDYNLNSLQSEISKELLSIKSIKNKKSKSTAEGSARQSEIKNILNEIQNFSKLMDFQCKN